MNQEEKACLKLKSWMIELLLDQLLPQYLLEGKMEEKKNRQ